MSATEPPFSIGIEEEYLLVDRETCDLAEAPDALMEACSNELDDQVSPEFLQCQIEIGTHVCAGVSEAREDLRHLRSVVAKCAAEHGLAPIAAACHPFSDWKEQHHTDRERYNDLRRDLGGVARRLLICGMHVHVGIPDREDRIDVMNQLSYFLPHILALSASSPFWQGEDTGLASYRLTVFDNLPRTGLPPKLWSWAEFQRSVDALVELDLIEDASKIWWDLRPSAKFPTIETRICDVSPEIETTLTIAALVQCLARYLWRMKGRNQRWRIYDNFLISENRWLAQRYGASRGLIDFGRREIVPVGDLIEELIELLDEDAEALGCRTELQAARAIIARGTSADRQRRVFEAAQEAGSSREDALRDVVRALIGEFGDGL
ncbi:carboxylate-amine ligase [Maritimibacter sp. UBA3975]|uniref:carboxylate-amine ligase n=1 Tax=Maritimibacter sp. UBA3975 TaxID=1946833 RepID=UPI000C094F42|nr:carboxylate-amine ligase [Maritimibacter sp. UBA3975]MAM61185.1 carboxylate-amine ligase [Maritimibacter sp.]|tara:strand:+ start:12372 stop:13505 length:1134 start_codon:yes stop_codon:yes gene_type:complete